MTTREAPPWRSRTTSRFSARTVSTSAFSGHSRHPIPARRDEPGGECRLHGLETIPPPLEWRVRPDDVKDLPGCRQLSHRRPRATDQESGPLRLEVECPDVGSRQRRGSTVLFDKDRACCAARQGLETHRAGSREEIEESCVGHQLAEHRKCPFAHRVRSRPDIPDIARPAQPPRSPFAGGDPHRRRSTTWRMTRSQVPGAITSRI